MSKNKNQGLPQVIRCVCRGRTKRALGRVRAYNIEDRMITELDAKLTREGWFARNKTERKAS